MPLDARLWEADEVGDNAGWTFGVEGGGSSAVPGYSIVVAGFSYNAAERLFAFMSLYQREHPCPGALCRAWREGRLSPRGCGPFCYTCSL